jgi:hypothetical protein
MTAHLKTQAVQGGYLTAKTVKFDVRRSMQRSGCVRAIKHSGNGRVCALLTRLYNLF